MNFRGQWAALRACGGTFAMVTLPGWRCANRLAQAQKNFSEIRELFAKLRIRLTSPCEYLNHGTTSTLILKSRVSLPGNRSAVPTQEGGKCSLLEKFLNKQPLHMRLFLAFFGGRAELARCLFYSGERIPFERPVSGKLTGWFGSKPAGRHRSFYDGSQPHAVGHFCKLNACSASETAIDFRQLTHNLRLR